jgi:preprotein translocase subunit SecF
MFIIRHKFIFITISAVLALASIVILVVFGLPFGTDFRGGSLLNGTYETARPDVVTIVEAIKADMNIEATVTPVEDKGITVKTLALTETEHQALLKSLALDGETFTESSFNSIGPSVGEELKRKSIVSIVLVSLGIVFFIAYAFRKVSRPISSWKYGLIAIGTLLHDVLIPVGIFSILAHFKGFEVDTLFVVAVLTILGLSVSDTIVVFDRIRENLRKNNETKNNMSFAETVGTSISQTFTRSINTSLTVIIALLALVFFGPHSTQNFALMLTAGMFFGTYSSIFLASPLLVVWAEKSEGK